MSIDNAHHHPQGNILVVEDNTSHLKLILEILTKAGYQVRPASDGELALRSVQAKLPDLILLDVNLPGINGVEVCRRLKGDPVTKDIPVIFISALGETELKVKALEAGGTDYVTKPIESSEILARINTHLKMHRLQLSLADQSEKLTKEIEDRKQAESELAKYHDHLEELVKHRTAELQQEMTEHKKAKKALQKSEGRLKKMIEKSPLPMVITDANQDISYFNDKFTKLFGYTLEDVSSAEEWWNTAYPDNTYRQKIQQSWIDAIEKAAANNTDIEMQEWDLTIKDRTKRRCEFHMVPLSDFSLIIMNDITERKKVENALKMSEEKFAKAFHYGPMIMTISSIEDGTYLDVNDNFVSITGYSREESIGTTSVDLGFISKTVRDRLKNELMQTGHVNRMALTLNKKNGDTLYCQYYGEIITVAGEQRLLSIGNDITKQRDAQEELKKLSTAIKQSPVSIVITNSSGDIEYVNPKFCKLTGYSLEEVLGKNPRVLQSGGMPKKTYEKLWKTILGGKEWRGEFHNKKKNGELYWENAVISPILNESGDITHFLAVKEDITENKKLEARLQQAQKMESIGTLAGGIAHDFNNILFPIMGHTEMILEDISEDSALRPGLSEIYTGAIRASELVKQILTFSRQESGELKLMRIQPIIKEALKLIRSTIPTIIEIKQNIQTDCGVIKADPTQIHQIIMNLATNAYHAMEDIGGELKVSLKQVELGALDLINPDIAPGVYICLTIADTGKGMDKKLTQKIFDPFFTTKEKGKGTGMGLSVVHGIVKSMNGAVQVYSEPGKGTEFEIYFPVEKGSFKKQTVQTHEAIQGGIDKILLVDDEDAIITMEKVMLERLGYQVTSRTSSIDALEVFRNSPDKFDIVITDMAMPNMSGDKLSAELNKIRPDIPVLLCTGFSESISEEKAASLGIKGFLLKPIVMKDFAQKIREVLDGNKK